MARIEPKTVRHQVGTCPACRVGLWAEVTVKATVSDPTLSADGRSINYGLHPEFEGMRIHHRCSRDDRGEWEWDA